MRARKREDAGEQEEKKREWVMFVDLDLPLGCIIRIRVSQHLGF